MNKYCKWLLVLFLVYYIWPLFNFQQNLVGGDGDVYAHAKMTEWFCDNYFSYNFQTTDFFAPYGVNMTTSYDMPLLITLVCPLRSLGGVAMINAIAVMQIGLIFLFAYKLAQKYISNSSLRMAFVFLYGFSPFALVRMGAHMTIFSTIWTTSMVFYLFDDLNVTKVKKVVLSFVLLGLSLVSAWQNIPNLFVLVLVMLAFAWLRAKNKLAATVNVLVGGVVMVIVMAPFALAVVGANMGRDLPTTLHPPIMHTNWKLMLLPSREHITYKWFPELWRGENTAGEGVVGVDTVVWLLALVAVVGALRKKFADTRWKYAILLIAYGVIPYGQIFVLGGETYSVGYFYKLWRMVPFSLTRVPSRLSVVFIFMLIFMVITWLDGVLKKKSARVRGVAAAVVMLYAIASTTVLMGNVRVRTVNYGEMVPEAGLAQIEADPSDEKVLNIPLYGDPTQNFLYMYHKKPMISGYVSYTAQNEPHTFKFINNSPVLKGLGCVQDYEFVPEAFESFMPENDHRLVFGTYLRRAKVGWVIVNKDKAEGLGGCENLNEFGVSVMPGYEDMELLEENDHYAIYELADVPVEDVDEVFVSYTPGGFVEKEGKVRMMGNLQTLYVITLREGRMRYSMRVRPPGDEEVKVEVKVKLEKEEYQVSGRFYIRGELEIDRGVNIVHVTSDECPMGGEKTECVGMKLDELEFEWVTP